MKKRRKASIFCVYEGSVWLEKHSGQPVVHSESALYTSLRHAVASITLQGIVSSQ